MNYYDTSFALIHHYNYSLMEIENMLPWEKMIYVGKILQYLDEENQRLIQQKASNKRAR